MSEDNKIIEKPVLITKEDLDKMLFVIYNSDLPELKTKVDELLTKMEDLQKLAKDGTVQQE